MRRPQHIQTSTCDCIGEFMQTAAFVSPSHIFWPRSFCHDQDPVAKCARNDPWKCPLHKCLHRGAAWEPRATGCSRLSLRWHCGRTPWIAMGDWDMEAAEKEAVGCPATVEGEVMHGSKRGDLRRGKLSSTALWSRKAWRSLSKLSLVWIHRHHLHWLVGLALLASL